MQNVTIRCLTKHRKWTKKIKNGNRSTAYWMDKNVELIARNADLRASTTFFWTRWCSGTISRRIFGRCWEKKILSLSNAVHRAGPETGRLSAPVRCIVGRLQRCSIDGNGLFSEFCGKSGKGTGCLLSGSTQDSGEASAGCDEKAGSSAADQSVGTCDGGLKERRK